MQMSSSNDAQVYAKQLLLRRHGYPLWVPEPYGNTVTYRTKGVRIGDVGYVTPEGAFETLFNVRAAPEDPINERGVPEGFQQIAVAPEDLVHLPHFHQPGSVVTSASAKGRSCQMDLSTAGIPGTPLGAHMGAQFTWNSSEGAILHLPDGASRLASPPSLFRASAMKNWYKFANLTLHRAVPNGSLYLITGCDKTRPWMVGSFSSNSSDAHASMKLSAAGMASGGLSYSYTWETSSPAVYRTGPPPSIDSPGAIESNASSIDRDSAIFEFDAPSGQNQCIFLRRYRIMLRTTRLSHLLGSGSKVDVASISESHSKDVIATSPKVPYSNYASSYHQGSLSMSSTSSSSSSSSDTVSPRLFDNEAIMDFDVTLDIIPNLPQPYHPSNSINKYLLQKNPHIDVSIAHDNDWCCVLREEDTQFPDEAEFISRFFEKHQSHFGRVVCSCDDGSAIALSAPYRS
ncbi:hypothetical protein BD779DRAFT_542735 [Infundibulicybe gibba]|nr:hypothetical protein BD779DRAFT_542735 [Infundibulicybe gibba]